MNEMIDFFFLMEVLIFGPLIVLGYLSKWVIEWTDKDDDLI